MNLERMRRDLAGIMQDESVQARNRAAAAEKLEQRASMARYKIYLDDIGVQKHNQDVRLRLLSRFGILRLMDRLCRSDVFTTRFGLSKEGEDDYIPEVHGKGGWDIDIKEPEVLKDETWDENIRIYCRQNRPEIFSGGGYIERIEFGLNYDPRNRQLRMAGKELVFLGYLPDPLIGNENCSVMAQSLVRAYLNPARGRVLLNESNSLIQF